MNFTVQRENFTSLSVTGALSIEGEFQCYTLEPPEHFDDVKPRMTPFGVYELTIRWSWKHRRHLPHVENVPDFEAIEIHVGNFPKDTDGCTLVGTTLGPEPNYVGQSLVAFTKLFALMMEQSALTNPQEPDDKLHVWKVGQISYVDGRLLENYVVPDFELNK